MSAVIFLIRGISGSGKTTAAYALGGSIIATDDYFYDGGEYKFDPDMLGAYHAENIKRCENLMQTGGRIVVHNTFSQRWEMEPYIQAAKRAGYRLVVMDLYDGGCTDEQLVKRNSHGVPLAGIRAQRARWEFDWRRGSTSRPKRR